MNRNLINIEELMFMAPDAHYCICIHRRCRESVMKTMIRTDIAVLMAVLLGGYVQDNSYYYSSPQHYTYPAYTSPYYYSGYYYPAYYGYGDYANKVVGGGVRTGYHGFHSGSRHQRH